MTELEKLQKQVNELNVQKKKWEGRKSRLWFLLPMGANGFLSIVFTLETLDLCTVGTGGTIGLALNGSLIVLSLVFWSFSRISVWRTNDKIKRVLSKFAS